MRTAAIEIARKRPEAIVVALHPGTVETSLSADYTGHNRSVSAETAADNLLGVLNDLTPSDTGGFFAWDGARIPW